MSAKNWTECPRCKAMAQAKKARLERLTETAYGKMPQEKYQRLLRAVKRPIKLEDTLREYYEWGFDEGVFSINYHVSCTGCGFAFQHIHQQRVPDLDPEGFKKK